MVLCIVFRNTPNFWDPYIAVLTPFPVGDRLIQIRLHKQRVKSCPNYPVTPSHQPFTRLHFLDGCTLLVFVFTSRLLYEKRKELGDAASKLRNGLDKIDDTRAKVHNLAL